MRFDLRPLALATAAVAIRLSSAGRRLRKIIRRAPSRSWCRFRPAPRPISSAASCPTNWPNRPDRMSSSTIAAAPAAASERNRSRAPTPDGYTLLMGTIGTHSINPAVYAKIKYDPIADFAPIIQFGTAPNVLVVNSALPVKSVKELIAYIRERPGAAELRVVRQRHVQSSLRRDVRCRARASKRRIFPIAAGRRRSRICCAATCISCSIIICRCSRISRKENCARSRSPAPSASMRCRTCR